jgi:photosystem II stability/assembly factor-like uncharacterized protein
MTTYNSTRNVLRLSVAVFATILGIAFYLFPTAQTVYAGNNVWSPMGPYGVPIYSLAVASNNNQVVYAGVANSVGSPNVFKSVDGGISWLPSNNGIPSGDALDFAFDPSNPNIVYVATSAGLYKSSDAGGTWTLKSTVQINGVTSTLNAASVATSPVDDTLYLGSNCLITCDSTHGIYRSQDGGETWEHVFTFIGDVTTIAVAPSAPHIIYSGTFLQDALSGQGTIFKSTDGGDTWQRIDSSFGAPPFILSIAIDSHDAQVVYLGVVQNGIFKTTNGGQTWAPIGTGLGNINVSDIKVDPRNQQVMYLGGSDRGPLAASLGVFRSLDNAGLSWAAMNDGIGNRSVYSLAIDNGSPQSIYAGTSNGVWKYTVASGHTDDSISINDGALFTNQTAVTLTLTAPPLTDQMIISNDGGFGGATWESFVTQKPWTITAYGNYVIPRVVYAKFRTNGQISGQYQDDIILDQTPPTGSVQITSPSNPASVPARPSVTHSTPVLTNTLYLPLVIKNYTPGIQIVGLVLSAIDDLSGVDSMLISNNGTFTNAQWQVYATQLNWNVNEHGSTTVYVKFCDRAGNESQVYSATTTAP